MTADPAGRSCPLELPIGEEVRDEWLAVGRSTAPADRSTAERGVRTLYRQLRLDPPERVVWFGSPFAGMLAALLLSDQVRRPALVGRRLRHLRRQARWRARRAPRALERTRINALHQPLDEQVWRQARMTVAEAVLSDVGPHTRGVWLDHVWEQLHGSGVLRGRRHSPQVVWDRLWAPRLVVSGSMVTTAPANPPRLPTGYGHHEAAWLGRQQLIRGGSALSGDDPLGGLEAISRSSGWWWGFPDVAVLTERPGVLRLDVQHRLHAECGPATSYRDGYSLWAWHGTPVHHAVIEHPEQLSVAAVAAVRDRVLRRVMLERCGYGRVVHELARSDGVPSWRSRVTKVDSDQYGTLWRVRLRRDEPLQVVEVVDATPQHDGTRKVYFLRVPPAIRTARQAVAWTFQKHAADYGPVVET